MQEEIMSSQTTEEVGQEVRPLERVVLTIGGMTCSSCAARVERKLNRLDGVTATVNFATETAAVDYDALKTDPQALVATVEAIGYTATLPPPPVQSAGSEAATGDRAPRDETDDLRQRLLVSAVLSAPVILFAMVPALQFRDWQWLCL